jgi:hypothetical protein
LFLEYVPPDGVMEPDPSGNTVVVRLYFTAPLSETPFRSDTHASTARVIATGRPVPDICSS